MSVGNGFQTDDIPSFYYIEPVTSGNFQISFSEDGINELIGEVVTGHYTHTQLATAIREALVRVGALDYVVTFDRDSRKYDIDATDGTFDLLISSGTSIGNSVYSLIGFEGPDKTGAMSYQSDQQCGAEYIPQFPLQNYMKPGDIKRPTQASVSQSTSGKVQVVVFGDVRFLRFDLGLITSRDFGASSAVRRNLTGKEDAISFLDFCTTKRTMEMILDYKNKSSFINIFHEKNPQSSQGIGYELRPNFQFGFDVFEAKGLEFRIVE